MITIKEPVLVIMAAGMGSRYGGLKQIETIDEEGHKIIDFSIYDAIRANFKKIIFIIKKEIEEKFKSKIGDEISKYIQVEYVYQTLDNIPKGYSIPEGREKPWGTGHAVLSCMRAIDGPFAVINSDDYYGQSGFKMIYDYLISIDDSELNYAMVGYNLENTLTDSGGVARGICKVDDNNMLIGITERTYIAKLENGPAYTEDRGKTWTSILESNIVSMNMWGFSSTILKELNNRFEEFLEKQVHENPLKAEYFLPEIIGQLLNERKATVKVLKSRDKWYGITYKADKERVVKEIFNLKQMGVYPKKLWK
ncbi:sugar phosphate nucleotidyltransferase [Clostridium sp.]|uniref:sugar phosphate nucleotidyltransferase n=1 Tax=Clostridium sp. TaxID=1506 RepID=UPI0032163369